MKWQGKPRQDTTRHEQLQLTKRRDAAAVRNESECRSRSRCRRRSQRRRRCGRDHSLWSSPRGALQFKLHLKNCDASQRPHDQSRVESLPQSAGPFSLPSPFLLPSFSLPSLYSLRPIERSTKRAINRLTSSRACPEYCPSMGPTCARVERSSFFAVFWRRLPPAFSPSPNTHCVIYEVRKVKKKWEWEFELSAFSLSFARRVPRELLKVPANGEEEEKIVK